MLIPKTNDIAKPISPLRMVEKTTTINFEDRKILMVAASVFSGDGRINSESYIIEPIFHKTTRNRTEMRDINLFFERKNFINVS